MIYWYHKRFSFHHLLSHHLKTHHNLHSHTCLKTHNNLLIIPTDRQTIIHSHITHLKDKDILLGKIDMHLQIKAIHPKIININKDSRDLINQEILFMWNVDRLADTEIVKEVVEVALEILPRECLWEEH